MDQNFENNELNSIFLELILWRSKKFREEYLPLFGDDPLSFIKKKIIRDLRDPISMSGESFGYFSLLQKISSSVIEDDWIWCMSWG